MALIRGIPGSVSPNTRIKGFDIVLANLNREIKAIENRSLKGLIMAAAHVRDKTEHEIPLTPVDYGNLRSSWFVVTAKGKVANDSWNKGFVGPNVAEMVNDHTATITECKGIVAANEATKGKFLMMGYSANYALFVHEMVGANFNPEKRKGKAIRREGAGAKWFEEAFKRNSGKIIQIIKDNAQIKG